MSNFFKSFTTSSSVPFEQGIYKEGERKTLDINNTDNELRVANNEQCKVYVTCSTGETIKKILRHYGDFKAKMSKDDFLKIKIETSGEINKLNDKNEVNEKNYINEINKILLETKKKMNTFENERKHKSSKPIDTTTFPALSEEFKNLDCVVAVMTDKKNAIVSGDKGTIVSLNPMNKTFGVIFKEKIYTISFKNLCIGNDENPTGKYKHCENIVRENNVGDNIQELENERGEVALHKQRGQGQIQSLPLNPPQQTKPLYPPQQIKQQNLPIQTKPTSLSQQQTQPNNVLNLLKPETKTFNINNATHQLNTNMSSYTIPKQSGQGQQQNGKGYIRSKYTSNSSEPDYNSDVGICE